MDTETLARKAIDRIFRPKQPAWLTAVMAGAELAMLACAVVREVQYLTAKGR